MMKLHVCYNQAFIEAEKLVWLAIIPELLG